jgi:tRNA threonylcarbamoyl adenosine modification protein (Sua5/YciO/YrdC/YwlC family)
MAQYFEIHPKNPQQRLIRQVVDIIRRGGVIVYPTDSSYAVGCHIGDKGSMDRIRRIRRLDNKHNFTLVTRDLSEISLFAKIDNEQFRMIKSCTPGPYTFIVPATRQLPRRLKNPKRKTIGLRIPDSEIVHAILTELGEPIMSSTLILPGQELPLSDPQEIRQVLEHDVDAVIDGGHCGFEPTTVVEWIGEIPVVVRRGKGDAEVFEQLKSLSG